MRGGKEEPELSGEDRVLLAEYGITGSVDLAKRIKEIRAKQGLKQVEVARRVGVNIAMPSLWEQGKRLVPLVRIRPLADSLEVTLEELLDIKPKQTLRESLTNEMTEQGKQADQTKSQENAGKDAPIRVPGGESVTKEESNSPLKKAKTNAAEPNNGSSKNKSLLPDPDISLGEFRKQRISTNPKMDQTETQAVAADSPAGPWVVIKRPMLDGFIPEGWEPKDRLQDISPSLPDGYWLDPVKLEKSRAQEILRSRLCGEDSRVIAGQEVPGAAMAERIYQHCGKQDGWLRENLPIAEKLFRQVLSADHGGLTDGALVEIFRERAGGIPITATLLRRLRESLLFYPVRRVDADLFGGRR